MKVNLQFGSGHDRTYQVHEGVHGMFVTDAEGREWYISAGDDGGLTVQLANPGHQVAVVPGSLGVISIRKVKS